MYTLSQHVFGLSLLVGSEDDKHGTAEELQQGLQSAIATYLANPQLQGLIGDGWSQVWGPVVWQAPGSTVADNAMVVFFNAGGSNGGSLTASWGSPAPTRYRATTSTSRT